MEYQTIGHLSAAERQYLERRFWPKVKKGGPGGCWLWQGMKNGKGYGRFIVPHPDGRRRHTAQRISYELCVGPIPDGLLVCHRCDNPACVNPTHLFLGDHQDNMDDMWRKGRAADQTGMNNGNSKLTRQEVREIRAKYQRGEYGLKRLAEEYGVHLATIHLVVARKKWTHI